MTDHRTTSSRRPTCPRLLLPRAATVLVGAQVAVQVVGAGPAAAHVTVQPGSVEGGGYAVVALRVPNERDDAATTRVRVLLPTEQPLSSVQTTPVPGWRARTAERELDEPLEVGGSEVSTVVSEVVWTAEGEGVRPGQFQDFALSLGPLPESGELVFRAVQTYDSGERVTWNETTADPAVEPEHPAPVLTLTPPQQAPAAVEAPGAAAGSSDEQEVTAPEGDGPVALLPVGVAVLALLTALAALGVALKRRTG